MLEKYLVTQCAPTLANLKTASLFRCLCPGRGELDAWRQALGSWPGPSSPPSKPP